MHLLFVLLPVAALACSTTRSVRVPLSGDAAEDVNGAVGGRDVDVSYERVPSRVVEEPAKKFLLTQDEARWSRPGRRDLAESNSIPLQALRTVRFCDGHCRVKGALEGAGFGLLLGAALGLGAAQATYNPNSDATQNLRYAVYPGALAGLAGIVGAVIGAAISHRTIIEFESQ